MEQRSLFPGGPAVSALGLGCNAFGTRIDMEGTRTVVNAALDAGIMFFDTADGYGRPFGASEEMLGRALAGVADRTFLATKGGANPAGWDQSPDASAQWLAKALDDSLRRLSVERIDLYQIHFPDPLTPIEETLRAMENMLLSGKVGYIGCSNFSVAQLEQARAAAKAMGVPQFRTAQAEYSLLERREGAMLLPALDKLEMSLLPYFPLAGGLLTGKYQQDHKPVSSRFARDPSIALRFGDDASRRVASSLAEFARINEMALIDLAFAWLLDEPLIPSVIAGATSAEQVCANVKAATRRLSADQRLALNDLLDELAKSGVKED